MTASYLLREASKSSVTFLSVTCLRCWAVHFTVFSLCLLIMSFILPRALAVQRNDCKIPGGTILKPVLGSKLEGVSVAGRVHRLISYSIMSSSDSASSNVRPNVPSKGGALWGRLSSRLLLLYSEKGLRFLKIRGLITRQVHNPCPFLQPL